MTLFPTLRGTASWGPPGDSTSIYRYTLARTWAPSLPTVVFVMTNPSTADDREPDPTITRCLGFARDAGFGRLVVVNLWAFRHEKVRELVAAHKRGVDIVGPQNDGALLAECLTGSPTVVCAWGPPRKVPDPLRPRFGEVEALLRMHEVPLHVLALTEDGHPRHPLMLPSHLRPVPWSP